MTEPMPFLEWLFRNLALQIEPYRPPPIPRPVTLEQMESTMRIKATPPALAAGVVSLELHYTPQGGTEQTLSLTTEPVEFDVDTAGAMSYFTVAVNAEGVKSDPCPTETFGVTDTSGTTKPPVPGNVTLEQVG